MVRSCRYSGRWVDVASHAYPDRLSSRQVWVNCRASSVSPASPLDAYAAVEECLAAIGRFGGFIAKVHGFAGRYSVGGPYGSGNGSGIHAGISTGPTFSGIPTCCHQT